MHIIKMFMHEITIEIMNNIWETCLFWCILKWSVVIEPEIGDGNNTNSLDISHIRLIATEPAPMPF
jgi:hypothetical protein